MTREIKIKPPHGYPLFGWSRETIKQHFVQHPPHTGHPMIIYNAHAGMHRYSLAVIDCASSGRQKRVILSKAGDSGGCSFYRTGINTFMPKGKTFMLPPVPELMVHLTLDCDVILDLPPYGTGG